MATLRDSQNYLKKESQFIQIDYLLLALSVCGFSFVIVCLLVVFLRKKFQNQSSRISEDLETDCQTTFVKNSQFFNLKPPLIPQNRAMNNSTEDCRRLSDSDKSNQYYDNEEMFGNKTIGNHEYNENSDSLNLDDQYNPINDGIFNFMYPQLSLQRMFLSPKPPNLLTKPSISITEITNEDDLNQTANKIEKRDLTESNHGTSTEYEQYIIDTLEKSLKLNSFNNDKMFMFDDLEEHLKSIDNLDERESFKQKLCLQSLFIKSNCAKASVDSENDSQNDTKSLDSIKSDSSGIKKAQNALSPDLIEETSIQKTIPDKLSEIRISNQQMDDINKRLLSIDNDIKLLPSADIFDSIESAKELENDNTMATRFESLQKEISNFLERTINLENNEQFVSKMKLEKHKPDFSNILQSCDLEDNLSRNLEDLSNQDDLFFHSSSPCVNPESNNFPTPNVEMESTSDSICRLNDSRIIEKDDTNVQEIGKVRAEKNSEMFSATFIPSTDSVLPVRTDNIVIQSVLPINNDNVSFELGSTNLKTNPTIQTDFEKNDETLNENNNDSVGNIDDETSSIAKYENFEELKDSSLRFDDSRSSLDTKFVKQTNRNASVEADNEPLRVHHFRGRNVQEAVKLFENGSLEKRKLEFAIPAKFHKRQK